MITETICKNLKNFKGIIKINLDDEKWNVLDPEFIAPFYIDELLRPCDVYPNGLYPGATIIKEKNTNSLIQKYFNNITIIAKQRSKVYKFHNYVEFSKVDQNDIFLYDNNNYLTSVFFERRKEAWNSLINLYKNGKILAYCFNGILYHINDVESINKIIYGQVYSSLIINTLQFQEIKNYYNNDLKLEFISKNNLFINGIKYILLNKI